MPRAYYNYLLKYNACPIGGLLTIPGAGCLSMWPMPSALHRLLVDPNPIVTAPFSLMMMIPYADKCRKKYRKKKKKTLQIAMLFLAGAYLKTHIYTRQINLCRWMWYSPSLYICNCMHICRLFIVSTPEIFHLNVVWGCFCMWPREAQPLRVVFQHGEAVCVVLREKHGCRSC